MSKAKSSRRGQPPPPRSIGPEERAAIRLVWCDSASNGTDLALQGQFDTSPETLIPALLSALEAAYAYATACRSTLEEAAHHIDEDFQPQRRLHRQIEQLLQNTATAKAWRRQELAEKCWLLVDRWAQHQAPDLHRALRAANALADDPEPFMVRFWEILAEFRPQSP